MKLIRRYILLIFFVSWLIYMRISAGSLSKVSIIGIIYLILATIFFIYIDLRNLKRK